MANPVCLSPLKFYDALEKQERYKSYAYGHTSPVVMPFNILYPFQFVAHASTNSIAQVYIYDAGTNKKATENIIIALREDGLKVKDVSGYKVVMLPGIFPLQEIKLEGAYYISLTTDRGITYYSEVFCFTRDYDKYIELEYWHPEYDFLLNNGVITFKDNFHFKALINSQLGKPEYSFEEEATNRLGYSFIESQISKKIYKFNTILPEYMCDALRLVRLCSHKKLTSLGETYEMLSFGMDVDWQEQGDLASVNCEFEVDNVISNFGGFMYEPKGGDFDEEEFNNDFDND